MKRILISIVALVVGVYTIAHAGSIKLTPQGQGFGTRQQDGTGKQDIQEIYPRACKCTTPTVFQVASNAATVLSLTEKSSTYKGGWTVFVNITGTTNADVSVQASTTPVTTRGGYIVNTAASFYFPIRLSQSQYIDIIGSTSNAMGNYQKCWDEN